MKGHLLPFFPKVDYNHSVEDEEHLKHLPPSNDLHLSLGGFVISFTRTFPELLKHSSSQNDILLLDGYCATEFYAIKR